jgi:hypothetical protein
MQCSSNVDAQVLYSFYAANGVKLSEAAVFSSPPGQAVQILADNRDGAQVGLAITNDSDQANTYTISAYDANGSVVGSRALQLGPRSSEAKFVSQFVTLPPNYVGPVVVSGTGPVSILGLRYTGQTFTTIPETIRGASASVTVTRAFTVASRPVCCESMVMMLCRSWCVRWEPRLVRLLRTRFLPTVGLSLKQMAAEPALMSDGFKSPSQTGRLQLAVLFFGSAWAARS